MAFRNKIPLHRLAISKLLLGQLLIAVITAFIFYLVEGKVAAANAVLGGMLALLPNIYFAIKCFRYFGAQSAVSITLSFWTGEMGKYVLTIALFSFVFVVLKPNNLIALFVSYFLVLMVSSLGFVTGKKKF